MYKKAFELDPNDSAANNGLGLLYYDKNRLSEAEELYRKAIQLDPNNSNAHNNLGYLCHNTNRL